MLRLLRMQVKEAEGNAECATGARRSLKLTNEAKVALGVMAEGIMAVVFELGLVRAANTGLFPVNISTQSAQIIRSRL